MNPIDIAVLVILALFALAGLYRGFLTALFNLGALSGFYFAGLAVYAPRGQRHPLQRIPI